MMQDSEWTRSRGQLPNPSPREIAVLPILQIYSLFFDGEEAQGRWTDKNSIQWADTNNPFGSREMAAKLCLSGELKQVEAMILADMIGPCASP